MEEEQLAGAQDTCYYIVEERGYAAAADTGSTASRKQIVQQIELALELEQPAQLFACLLPLPAAVAARLAPVILLKRAI